MNRAKLCSIAQIARILEVSEQTVKNWVLWYPIEKWFSRLCFP